MSLELQYPMHHVSIKLEFISKVFFTITSSWKFSMIIVLVGGHDDSRPYWWGKGITLHVGSFEGLSHPLLLNQVKRDIV